MIGFFLKGFGALAKKPLALLPAFLVAAIIGIAYWIVIEQFFDLAVRIFFLEQVPDSGLSALPFQLMNIYAGNILALALASAVSLIAIFWASFFYSNFAGETGEKKPSLGEAFAKTNSQIGGVIIFFVFLAFLALFFSIIIWALLAAAIVIPVVPAILAAIVLIGIVYLAVKIFFALPIMALEKEKLKPSLAKSWEFTNNRFWAALLFIIITMVISGIITQIGGFISDSLIDPFAGAVIMAVFWAIALAYTTTTIALYYIEKS